MAVAVVGRAVSSAQPDWAAKINSVVATMREVIAFMLLYLLCM